MGTRGPKPKPARLHLLRGNPGKRPLRLGEFTPAAAIPKCPAHLRGEARREWKRITEELHRYGIISELDRGIVAMACALWARHVEAERALEQAKDNTAPGEHLVVRAANGYPSPAPLVAVSNRSIEQYKSLCAELGCTPASRSRVTPGEAQPSLPGMEPPTETGGWEDI